jgi:hypothetical protein
MKVSVNTVGEFIENLSSDAAHIEEVWVRVDEFRVNEANDFDWNVALWLTCIVARPSVPYILEFGQIVGPYITAGDDKTDVGHINAKSAIAKIESACEGLKIPTRSGKVEF